MTRKEAAIVSAYTGILICEFSDFHEYIEKILNRPVFRYELADKEICVEIKEKSRKDFINIIVE